MSESEGRGLTGSRSQGRDVLARVAALATPLALLTFLALGVLAVSAALAGATSFVYVANIGSRNVSAYSIGSDGGLSPVAGSPFAAGFGPLGVAASPDGEHLYVTNVSSEDVSAYSIAADGGLSPVTGSPFATGTEPWGVASSPDGEHLYVVNRGSNSVSAYSVESDGSLSPVMGSPFPTAIAPGDIASNGVAVTPDGEHLYVTNMTGSVTAFSVAPSGSLSPVLGSPFEAGDTARPVSITPDGKYLYVGTLEENIWVYSIGSDGDLSPIVGSPFFTEGQSLGLAISPDGAHLYAAHVGWGDNVWGYSIGPSGGLSTVPGSPFPTGSWRGNSVAVIPDSKHVYTTNSGLSNLSAYSIGPNGSLSTTVGSPFATGSSPIQVVATPDQPPFAAFSATPTPAGNASMLDASASNDPDDSVATYQWDFGDGQSMVTSSAAIGHVYASPGHYTITLTVADTDSCSTTQTFTGQTVSCNGSPLAQVSHQISVPPGMPLDVSLGGSGSGSVTSSPAGVDCPGACSYFYVPETQVTLAASPAPGSIFSGWSGGGCSGVGACHVTVDGGTDVTATFSKAPPPSAHMLTLDLAGDGAGRVEDSRGAISCPFTCSHSYLADTQVALIAEAAPGSSFAGWSGGGCGGRGGCHIAMDADAAVTATFEQAPSVLPRLRIRQVHPRVVRSKCGGELALVSGLLKLQCTELRLVIRGTIAKPARGLVGINIKARAHRRWVTGTKTAEIASGRWHTRAALPVVGGELNAPIYIGARFSGSPGVQPGHVRRRVQRDHGK